MTDEEKNLTGVMFMNVRGLQMFNYFPRNREVLALVHATDVDILGIVEVIINWDEVLDNHQ